MQVNLLVDNVDHTMKSGQYCDFCKFIACFNQVLAAVLKVLFSVGIQTRNTCTSAVISFLWKSVELKNSLQVKHLAKHPPEQSLFKGWNQMYTSGLHACLSAPLNIYVAAFQNLVFTDLILRFFLQTFLWKKHTDCSDVFRRRKQFHGASPAEGIPEWRRDCRLTNMWWNDPPLSLKATSDRRQFLFLPLCPAS